MGSSPVALRFTETMKGFVDFDERAPLEFTLTICFEDMEAFKVDPMHYGRATGVVRCSKLGGELAVERGDFNLFVAVGIDPDVRQMRYRLFCSDTAGRQRTVVGHKVVTNNGVLKIWRDTTTLFTTVFDGHVEPADDEDARVLAAGILRIKPLDFARQLTTFRASGGSLPANVGAFATFGGRFASTLVAVYLRPAK